MNNDENYLIYAKNVSKYFSNIVALKEINFKVKHNEIVALLGDNGAGKSTLIKILSGVLSPDEGNLLWEGKNVHLRSPRDAMNLGISTVYQDLGLVDLMSIYRNMFLGREQNVSKRIGPIRLLQINKARKETNRALENTGISMRSVDEPAAKLSGGERQSIAIARAIYFETKLLIMDEPCAALGIKETNRVLGFMEKAREEGVSVIFISHNLHHVYPIADTFSVLSHGELIGSFERGEKNFNELSDIITLGSV